MGISNFTLTKIFNECKDALLESKIERIINVSDNNFLLSIYKENSSRNVLLSLDPSLPLLLMAKSSKINNVNTANMQCNMLKKYFDHGFITNIEKVENDRIIILDVKKWTQSYQLIECKMIFELFPLSPNIIITDQNYVILDAFKKSESLDSKHPIYKNLKYQFPIATDKYFTKDTPLEQMKGKLNKAEYRYLESLSEEDYFKALEKMLIEKDYYIYKNDVSSLPINEDAKKINLDTLFQMLLEKKTFENKEAKYEHIFKLVNQKIKALNKKITNLEQDKDKFLNNSDYMDKGNLLFYGSDDYKRGDTSVVIEGIKIDLDSKLDLKENAQRYFKLYKKSKSGLIQVELQKQKAIEELSYFEGIENQLQFASTQDIQDILLDLVENHYLKDQKVINRNNKKPGNKRYQPHYIILKNGTKIGYGLSSFQNEELTFNVARKDDIYLHVKDFHGPHVILFNPTPSEEELRIAGEIALYYASKTAGEVYYVKRQYVKKVPANRGLVTMTNEKLMVINQINQMTLDYINKQ